jgi:hypothetical protein
MDVQQANRASERFPLAGKWQRRLMILFILLVAAWFGVGSVSTWQLVAAIAGAVVGGTWALGELYGVIRRRGDYVELLADGMLLVGGTLLSNVRIAYETIASVQVKDRWSDRMARGLLKIVGRANPPRVEVRFRRRVFFWWAIWPRKGMDIRLSDPQALVAALSPRVGAT